MSGGLKSGKRGNGWGVNVWAFCRSIDDSSLVYDVLKLGAHDEMTLESSDLSLEKLLELRDEWLAHWTPTLPKDDTLTPIMLAITSMQPIAPPIVIPKGMLSSNLQQRKPA